MFNELMNIIRQEGQQSIVENPEIPNEHNEAVMNEASTSIHSSMQGLLQQGGPSALKNLFQGVQSGNNNSPEVQQVSNNFSGNLMQKFGLNSGAAKALAATLIPVVLSKLMNRASNNGGGSGFNIGSILSSLTGGAGGNMQPNAAAAGSGSTGPLSGLGGMLNLDKNGDGHTDLKDLMSMFGR